MTITGVKSGITLSSSVTIPSKIDGQAVVAIGSSAFSNCTQLSQITIPASITSMGADVFEGCSNLSIVLQRDSVPLAWDENWNPDNRPVSFTISGGCGTSHTIAYTYNTINHTKYCSVCGDSVTGSHTYIIIPRYNGTVLLPTHYKRCSKCLYQFTELHMTINGQVVCCPYASLESQIITECIECDGLHCLHIFNLDESKLLYPPLRPKEQDDEQASA